MHQQSKVRLALLVTPFITLACSGADSSYSEPTSTDEAAATVESAQYGFESNTQNWQSSSGAAVVSRTTASAYAGAGALSVAFNGTSATTNVSVASPQVPAGSKVTFHINCPTTTAVDWMQPFVQQGASGGWAWTSAWAPINTLKANTWNAVTVTVPSNAAALASLGVQFHTTNGAASTCMLDSIGWGSGTVVADAGAPAVDSGKPPVVDSGKPPVVDSGPPPVVDSGAPPPPPPTGSKWVSGYYVGYQQSAYPPSAIDFTALTHIIVGNVVPQTNGTLDTGMSTNDGPGMAKSVSGLAHAAGKKAILMLGGAGASNGFSSSSSPTYRATFVANLKALTAQLGYDGLDLDWEPIASSDYANFEQLLRDLRAAIPGVILTMPIGWNGTTDPFYATVAPMLDQMNMMSYGMADAWPGWQSWHSTALYGDGPTYPSSIDRAVKAYTKLGVPPARLGMGIGFYGECWGAPVTGPRQNVGGGFVRASDNSMSYTNIMSQYYTAGARQWDATAMVPFLSFSSATGPSGCTFVSYDDPQSIIEKGKYAKANGVGGTIIWTVAQGYLPNAPAGQKNPLLTAVKTGFLQ